MGTVGNFVHGQGVQGCSATSHGIAWICMFIEGMAFWVTVVNLDTTIGS